MFIELEIAGGEFSVDKNSVIGFSTGLEVRPVYLSGGQVISVKNSYSELCDLFSPKKGGAEFVDLTSVEAPILIGILERVSDFYIDGFGSGDIIETLQRYDFLMSEATTLTSITDGNGGVNVRRLGRFLMKIVGRTFDGQKVIRCGTLTGGRPKWAVESVNK